VECNPNVCLHNNGDAMPRAYAYMYVRQSMRAFKSIHGMCRTALRLSTSHLSSFVAGVLVWLVLRVDS
jgi:hypothetical protein